MDTLEQEVETLRQLVLARIVQQVDGEIWFSSGHNPLYVAGQLGHSGTALLDVYARWVDDWKDEREVKYGT